ncbi:sensor histidine kinase [Chishuiella sp.]|uniref:sensor histidine kinase n=1 Tax=Chishuiella sp. TaxID=1969467 RepID=UPI0028B20B76|nr:sensor histidine kinase [Chishuiella sp.]
MDIEKNTILKIIQLEKYYTQKVRIFGHIFIWLSYTLLMYYAYSADIGFSFNISMFISLRLSISSAVVFYSFFYLFLPYILKKRKYYYLIFTPLLVVLWLFVTEICYIITTDILSIDLSDLQKYLGKKPLPSLNKIFSLEYILLNTYSVILALSPFFFIKIFVDMTRMYIKSIKSEKQKYRLEIEKINIEKQFLLAQLNPHFFFNTLNNIYGLIITQDKNAGKMVLDLSKIMKYTLYENGMDKVPLERELEFIRNYFNVNISRFSSDILILLKISGNSTELYIAPLITFVFIENAFKYGLKTKNHKFLNITIKIEDSIFNMLIENDKIKLEETESSGIGISNATKRLNMLYPNRHVLTIDETETKYSVSLQINLNDE